MQVFWRFNSFTLIMIVADGPLYDSTAYTKCRENPEEALYNGGILKGQSAELVPIAGFNGSTTYSPAFILQNLSSNANFYSFSIWIKIKGSDSALVTARLVTGNTTTRTCIGTVIAKPSCWSFLKGGFVFSSSSETNLSIIYFQSSDKRVSAIEMASSSLQPFTKQEWTINQNYKINTVRKRAVTIHVSDQMGQGIQGAEITVRQVAKDFPFGSAISKTILGNSYYQKWFVDRFNAAVFENELKWYATEPKRGQLNYTIADQMLEFVRSNQIIVRGHNIFWEDPKYTPDWVRNLTGQELQAAVDSRIKSLMSKYKDQFIHWDVSNEMLHFRFYEERLGPNATLHFFDVAHRSDPLATLFMNEFNVVETCADEDSNVDAYVESFRELEQGGVFMDGIGLEGHFTVPNPPLIRAIIDKLATLGLPIWLTEVDISSTLDQTTQALYLKEVLMEGFSHPAVDGIMLWTAMNGQGRCYQMCLTDSKFNNLATGDAVDELLKEWETASLHGQYSDEHGSYSFFGFLGEYQVEVKYKNKTRLSTFSLDRGDETRHFTIQL
ncbi:endo-1,4-beta-xylanase 5 [Impatiens glandulifera]|uniref:endo-1,4-beta-xylanase 5 n=1 Tax=Impatiens glandulifera TaxID=253017 RepID=UPI001FB174F3|nr:endo-1,4-beta-xylanase 5 [Impatiens glandulifera]